MTTTKKERFGMQIYLAKTMYIKSISFLRPPSASNPRIPFFAQSTLYGFGVCVFRLSFNNLALSVPVTVCVWVCVRFFFRYTFCMSIQCIHKKRRNIHIEECIILIQFMHKNIICFVSIERKEGKSERLKCVIVCQQPIVAYDSFSLHERWLRSSAHKHKNTFKYTHTRAHTHMEMSCRQIHCRAWKRDIRAYTQTLIPVHLGSVHLCSLQLSRSQLWNEKSINYQRSFSFLFLFPFKKHTILFILVGCCCCCCCHHVLLFTPAMCVHM